MADNPLPTRGPRENFGRTSLELTFHTYDIELFFRGGDKTKRTPYMPSYYVVARYLGDISKEMRSDNPFAENALIEIELRIDRLIAIADGHRAFCECEAHKAEQREGILMSPLRNDAPFRHRLDHAGEYGRFWGV